MIILWLVLAFALGVGSTFLVQWLWERRRIGNLEDPYRVVLGKREWFYRTDQLKEAKLKRVENPGAVLYVNGVYRG